MVEIIGREKNRLPPGILYYVPGMDHERCLLVVALSARQSDVPSSYQTKPPIRQPSRRLRLFAEGAESCAAFPPCRSVPQSQPALEKKSKWQMLPTMWLAKSRKQIAAGLLVVVAGLANSAAHSADRIRVAAQITGTLGWELEVLRGHGLDRKADLNIQTMTLASTEGGQIALKGGSVDLILSDWLWVSRERALGDDLVFYPYSSTLGAVMVPASSQIEDVASLKGRKLGVAGGPLDKSWILLQALARKSGVNLKQQSEVVYGAPPLLSEKALQGETDATLTFWNFCARLEAKGMRRAIEMADVMKQLGATGPVAMIGYVFHESWAKQNRDALDRFLAATDEAKRILANSPSEWQRLASRIGISDAAALDIYRRRYVEGIPDRPLVDEQADAKALYRVLANVGGSDLVGPARELAPGAYYMAGPKG
jgi:NitT/TauT family transport system substrate-binding protein